MDQLVTGLTIGNFDVLRFVRSGDLQDLNDVLDGLVLSGGGGGGLVTSVISPLQLSSGTLSINLQAYVSNSSLAQTLTSYLTATAINNILSGYTDTTGLTSLLSGKQDTIYAGTGISISNNTISSTHVPLVVQLDGVTQNITTLDFIENNSSISGGVLSVSRLKYYDQIPLRYSNAASDKSLTQGSSGELLWNNQRVALRNETFTQINHLPPLSGSVSGTVLTLETLFKPSTVSAGAGIFLLANDTNGTLTIGVSGLQISDITNLQASLNTLTTDVASLNTTLATKQDSLTAAEGVYINASSTGPGNAVTTTISSYKLRYQNTGQNQSTPSSSVQTLNFKDFTITESVNSNSEYQLEVALPTAQPISYITGLQAEVNKLSNVVVGTSGLSLGTGTGTSQRFAVYEASGSAFFYGCALFEGMNNNMGVGVGIYGGTNNNIPDQYGNGGSGTQLPHMLITRDGRVGIMNNNPQNVLDLVGNFKCTGNTVITSSCTAQSYVTSSDQSIKDDIQNADYQEIQAIFDAIDVKTYTKHGAEGHRIGFIANEFDDNISQESKFQNIVHRIAGEEEEEEEQPDILGLDYSRLCTLLWGICKNQEARIKALETKISTP